VAAYQETGVANSVAIRDSADREVKLLTIYDGAVQYTAAPSNYVTAPDFLRFKDQFTGDLRLWRCVNEQTRLGAT